MSPAGAQDFPPEQVVEHVTCLGCGCTCDDIALRIDNGRIAEARHACAIGVQWFGDGHVPAAVRVDSHDTTLETAIAGLAAQLQGARRPLIYLAPDLSCEAQRQATALADLLHASLDTVTSSTTIESLLASQERGRAGATLGEVRNRADLLVFWGVDPDVRYPRFWSRYAPEPAGLHVPDGRRSRTVMAVNIGASRGPHDADARMDVDPADEIALLTAVTAIIRKPGTAFDAPLGTRAAQLAGQLLAGRYIVVVADGEPPASSADGPSAGFARQRPSALIALVQALNGPTRAALSTLRGGGNRSGADAVLTAHTGYPTAVSFWQGVPSYQPRDDAAADAVLIVGDAARIPARGMLRMHGAPLGIVGPGASHHASARIAIDTGVAGIHVGGTVLRMDDVPLPLRPSIPGPRDPAEVIQKLIARVRGQRSDAAGNTQAPARPAR